MITHGEDVEIHALHKQGWSISAIARHLGLDRKTVRAHLAGERQAGVRRSSAVNPFDAVAAVSFPSRTGCHRFGCFQSLIRWCSSSGSRMMCGLSSRLRCHQRRSPAHSDADGLANPVDGCTTHDVRRDGPPAVTRC